MALMLSQQAYRRVIEEDVEWLKKQPRSLEREHIQVVLWDSIQALYERPRLTTCRAERLWAENRDAAAAVRPKEERDG